MPIKVLLKDYLANLKRIEGSKPPDQRRAVPSLTKLAKAIHSEQSTLSRMHTNRRLDLNLTDRILVYLNQEGFETKLSDILIWRQS